MGSMSIEKPAFVSDFEHKTRPAMKIVSLSGKGDPMFSFDEKIASILSWLETKGLGQNKPTLGIYYLYRGEVGVENVKWDACVPISNKVETEGEYKYQELPQADIVSVILTGGYDLIGPALKWLEDQAKAKNIKIMWPLTEIYLQEGNEPITELQCFVVNE